MSREETIVETAVRLLVKSARCVVDVDPQRIAFDEPPSRVDVVEVAVKLSTGQTLIMRPVDETTFRFSHGLSKAAWTAFYKEHLHLSDEEAAARAEQEVRELLEDSKPALGKGVGEPVGGEFKDWCPRPPSEE